MLRNALVLTLTIAGLMSATLWGTDAAFGRSYRTLLQAGDSRVGYGRMAGTLRHSGGRIEADFSYRTTWRPVSRDTLSTVAQIEKVLKGALPRAERACVLSWRPLPQLATYEVTIVLNYDRRAIRTPQWQPPTAEASLIQVGVAIPLWATTLGLWAYPALVLIRSRARRRRRRRKLGLCVQCGYDLTGNTSGTCPECGTSTCVAR